MLIGPSSLDLNVIDYPTAQRRLEASKFTRTGRARKERSYEGFPLGVQGSKAVRWVRERRDGFIAFKLYRTDVVAYHPDGRVKIQPYASTTTSSSFARALTPRGVYLDASGVVWVQTPEGEMCYHSVSTLTLTEAGENLWAVGDAGRDMFTYYSADHAKRRAAVARYNLNDFKSWCYAAIGHTDWRHAKRPCDNDELLGYLETRDFKAALLNVPHKSDKARYAYGREIEANTHEAINWRLLDALVAHAGGAFVEIQVTEVSGKKYNRVRKEASSLRNNVLPWYIGEWRQA
jgi:hypothetical protein